jgi:hypothetical protein
MSRRSLYLASGVAATAAGFARTFEPLIEVGIALFVVGVICLPPTNPDPKPDPGPEK